MKGIRFFALLSLLFFAYSQAATAIAPGKCTNCEIVGNQAVFTCDNNIKVQLKLCAQGIVKVWARQGDFDMGNSSFAVINEDIERIEKINMQEQPGSYEIYTTELIIRINKDPFQIRVFDKYQKLILEDYQDKGFVKENSLQKCSKTLRQDEHIFGLGEKNGTIDRRGSIFKMWNSDRPCYGTREDPIYKSIPFFFSNYGYAIFFDNTYKTVFDFGASNHNVYSFEAPGGEMVYYILYGPSYKKIIERYTQLTGKAIMPPEWALGFSQCRGLYTNEKLARDVANEFRKRQIPCDIIYQDIGWTRELQDFEWRKGNYDNPKKTLADLQAQGFKMIVSQDPVISQRNNKQWREADSLGYFVKDIRTHKTYDMPWPWGGNCGVVDFTQPQVADWWGNYQQKVLSDGVKGFWTDMGEPAWSNEEDTDRLNMLHHKGKHDQIHNVYGFTWDKVVTEQFEKHNPNTRVFQMTRSAFAGVQRYAFGWSGDSGEGSDVLNGWSKLAAQLPLSQSAGLGLIPFWTTDISGYCGDISDYPAMAELYVRWMQFGVFNPLSRAHHEGNNAAEPWMFGQEAERICREAISLKYKLHPYIYTYAREAYDKGLPLIRATILEFPDDPQAPNLNYQFMFGKELLVAPVVEKDASTKHLYLPEGEWIDFKDGKTLYKGSQWIDYATPLNTVPVFVKRGSIVPQMPVVQFIGEKKNLPVWFDVFPANEGRKADFSLYEDDGETNNYKKDIFCKTDIKCVSQTDSWVVTVESKPVNGWKSKEQRNMGIIMHLESKPKTILFNSRKIKIQSAETLNAQWYKIDGHAAWCWDKEKKTCTVKFFDNNQIQNLIIKK